MPSELIKPAARSTEAPKNMVRTDAREQKLDKFLSKSNHEPVPSPSENRTAKNSATDDSAVFELIDSTNSLELALQNRLNEKSSKEEKREGNETKKQSSKVQKVSNKIDQSNIGRNECKLTSVKSLRQGVDEECHEGLRELFVNHTFVGCANREFALVQHETKLYTVNIPEVTKHFFYQLMLNQFGSAAYIKLEPPTKVVELVRFALDLPEVDWSEDDGDKDEMAEKALEILKPKAEMLDGNMLIINFGISAR